MTTVVIGGGVTRAWPLLAPPTRAALAAEPPSAPRPIRLVRARHGTDAVAIGAAELA